MGLKVKLFLSRFKLRRYPVAHLSSEQGFTLPEIIVSAVIITITTFMVAQYLGQEARTTRNILSRGTCQSYMQIVKERLRTMGDRVSIINTPLPSYKMVDTSVTPNFQGSTAPVHIAVTDRWPDPSVRTNFQLWDFTTPDLKVRNAHLIDGTMAALTAIYNSNTGFCSNPGGLPYIGAGGLLPTNIQGINIGAGNAKIRIQYLDTTTGTYSCPSPDLIIAPEAGGQRRTGLTASETMDENKRFVGASSPPLLDSNVVKKGALAVTVIVDYQTNDGQSNRCTGNFRFSYPADGVQPPAVPGGSLPATVAAGDVPYFDSAVAGHNYTDNGVDVEEAQVIGAPGSFTPISVNSSDQVTVSSGTTPQRATPYPPWPGVGVSCASPAPASERSAAFRIKYNTTQAEPGSLLVCRDASTIVQKSLSCIDPIAGVAQRQLPIPRDSSGNNIALTVNAPQHSTYQTAQTGGPGAPVGLPPLVVGPDSFTEVERVIWDNQYYLGNPWTYRMDDALAVAQETSITAADPQYYKWVPCDSVNICGYAPGVGEKSVTKSVSGSEVTIDMEFTNLPEGCLAFLEWGFVDTAGNVSTQASMEKIIRVANCGNLCFNGGGSYYFFQCQGACP